MEKPLVFITGTSSGFGMGASIELCKHGYHVIASMRNAHRKTPLHTALQEENLENIDIVEMDVTNPAEIEKKVSDVISRYGKINILINNAGYAEGGLVEDVDMEAYRKQLETNFFGLVAVTKAVLPHMRKQQSGKIINMSSVSGLTGFPAFSPYASSKFAVEGFSECLRLEMYPHNIYVTLIEPGAYQTAIWEKGSLTNDQLQTSADKDMLAAVVRKVKKSASNAGKPREVIDLLIKVAQTKRPKLRYVVGKGIKQTLFLKKVIPHTWFEQIVMQMIKKRD